MPPKYGLFVSLVIVFCLVCLPAYAAASEADETAMAELASYATAGHAMTIILEQLNKADSEIALTNTQAINALKELEDFKTPYSQMYNLTQVRIEAETGLQEAWAVGTNSASIYNAFTEVIKGGSVLPLDILSITTSSYDFVQNVQKIMEYDTTEFDRKSALGQTGFALISAYSAYAGIATKLSPYVAKDFFPLLSTKVANYCGLVSVALAELKIYAVIYTAIRDDLINEITDNYTEILKDNIVQRDNVIQLLTDLYLEKSDSGQTVEYSDIYNCLNYYPPTIGKYAFPGQKFVASAIFNSYYSDATYLSTNFSVASFAELTNEERILLALNVLVEMAVVEG